MYSDCNKNMCHLLKLGIIFAYNVTKLVIRWKKSNYMLELDILGLPISICSMF